MKEWVDKYSIFQHHHQNKVENFSVCCSKTKHYLSSRVGGKIRARCRQLYSAAGFENLILNYSNWIKSPCKSLSLIHAISLEFAFYLRA